MSADDRFFASVSQGTLNKVTRLFNASLGDVFRELLQNARRAGASQVLVTRGEDSEGRPYVTVQDDGSGIAIAQTVFTLGDSDWDPNTKRSEDPAGMGVFSLSPRGASIQSKTEGMKTGWTVHVQPDHFKGEREIEVLETPDVSFDHGTKIVFPYDPACEAVEVQLAPAARYFPLPVLLDGEPLQQEDFLGYGIYRERWRGIEIGVRRKDYWSRESTINFFGVTVSDDLAQVHQVRGARYEARINVIDCPDLQLVLPARKEIVHGLFFEELKTVCKRAIFRAIATLPSHSLSYADWKAAKELGVDLPEATAELKPYTPNCADSNTRYVFGWAEAREASVPEHALIVDFVGDPQEHQVFWRALQRSDMNKALLEPVHKFEGYAWYDRIPKLKEIRFSTEDGGVRFDDLVVDDPNEGRPDRIEIELLIDDPGYADGRRSTVLSTDLLLTGEGYSYCLDDIGVQVTSDSDITPAKLAEILEAAYFSASDDVEADSYETQRDAFRAKADDLAIRLLISDEAAQKASLERAVYDHVVWLLPVDTVTDIKIRGRDVEITTTRREADAGPVSEPN